jgi:trehalose 6-phosphate synthase/phosphatase
MVTGYDNQFRSIVLNDRIVKADLFPLGIDYDKFHNAMHDDEVIAQKDSIRKNFDDRKIIFSVDRLDYTKGITHRLAGFERFLELHPEYKEHVVFVLVVVPSREIISKYNERLKLIEEQVGRLNGRYSTLQWQPVIYRYNHLSFAELCALYQTADVGLITPLRDGMNLVAKEYVASRGNQDGVLILSELAGAASELGEAVLVNSVDKNEMAEAIVKALTMPHNDQQDKMNVMQRRLKEYTVVDWVNDFFEQLKEVKEQQQAQDTHFLTSTEIISLHHAFMGASTRCLFLDYDGTLVPFAKHPKDAVPGQDLISLLQVLTNDTRNEITIISGRSRDMLQMWFGDMNVNLIAEHGAFVKLAGGEWSQDVEFDQSWKPLIHPILKLYSQRSPGSFVEEKEHTLAWHYRNVEKDLGFVRSRELLENIYHLIRNANLQVVDGNKVIEVRVAGIDKGTAALKLITEKHFDFIMAIGDDKTDEDMFRVLADKATTIKVGRGSSLAKYNLASQQSVIALLAQLADSSGNA